MPKLRYASRQERIWLWYFSENTVASYTNFTWQNGTLTAPGIAHDVQWIWPHLLFDGCAPGTIASRRDTNGAKHFDLGCQSDNAHECPCHWHHLGTEQHIGYCSSSGHCRCRSDSHGLSYHLHPGHQWDTGSG